MARRITVTVEDDVPLRTGETYPVVVFHIEKKTKPPRLEVDLLNKHADHEERVHRIVLALPLRRYGRTAEFFRAIGESVDVGRDIALRDALGKELKVIFAESPTGTVEIVSFKPFRESEHAANHQQSK